MNKVDIKQKLIKDGIFYGEKFTIQAFYSWDRPKEIKLIHYAVCENCYIEDGGIKHLCPIPIKDFEIINIDEAVKMFIEKEKESRNEENNNG